MAESALTEQARKFQAEREAGFKRNAELLGEVARLREECDEIRSHAVIAEATAAETVRRKALEEAASEDDRAASEAMHDHRYSDRITVMNVWAASATRHRALAAQQEVGRDKA